MTYPGNPLEQTGETIQTDGTRFDQTILIPLQTNPLNLNMMRTMHWATKGKHTKQWRTFVGVHAKRFPELPHVTLTLTWFVTDNRRRDETNLWGLFKPLADGIVDSGCVPDDDSRYVTGYCKIVRAPEGVKVPWMELRIQGPEPVQSNRNHIEVPTIIRPMNADCVNGKHHACGGDAWDFMFDRETVCECSCHSQVSAA